MISIIVPVYNGERYIKECVDSVLTQKGAEWELIVVDDGSTDRTAAIMSGYDDSRIRYILKHNSGVTETRWKGVEASCGEWVTFLDADDILLTDCLEIISSQLNNSVDIVSFGYTSFSSYKELNQINQTSAKEGKLVYKSYPDQNLLCKEVLLGKSLPCLWGNIYKRELLSQNKQAFLNGLKVAEDTFFNLEICLNSPLKIKTIPAKLYGYRENPSSVTRSVTPGRFDNINQAIEYLDSLLGRQPAATRKELRSSAGFRELLLWSTFMFHTDNPYYTCRKLRNKMRRNYFRAFRHLYPYLKAYLFVDLFVYRKVSQCIIQLKSNK